MKSKLKPVDKEAYGYDPFENDMYHCCRWCHYFKNGKCLKDSIIDNEPEDLKVYEVIESGKLHEMLREVFSSLTKEDFEEIEGLVRTWGVSQKKLRELKRTVKDSIEHFGDNPDVIDTLADEISELYVEELSNGKQFAEGIPIKDPEDFYCKYFW